MSTLITLVSCSLLSLVSSASVIDDYHYEWLTSNTAQCDESIFFNNNTGWISHANKLRSARIFRKIDTNEALLSRLVRGSI